MLLTISFSEPSVLTAGIPTIKEPSGPDRQDGKGLDGLTLITWPRDGRSLTS